MSYQSKIYLLSQLLGFQVRKNSRLSDKFGRELLDIPHFVDQFRASYARSGPFYYDLEKFLGTEKFKQAVTLIDDLTVNQQ